MRVLLVNVVCGIRSTGRICGDLADALAERGHTVKIAYGRYDVPEKYRKYALRTTTDTEVTAAAAEARIADNAGFSNRASTARLIEKIKDFDPDVIHLHVLHGYWLNVELLFNYLRTCGKKIIWTFHDCWAFTGHCAYFDYAGCDRWQTRCFSCPNKGEYPASSFADRSGSNYEKKKELFTGIPDLTVVTPSRWLARNVEKSFLGGYPVKVIPNGIDTEVFAKNAKTEEIAAGLEEMYGLQGKKTVIAVSTSWDSRKGLREYYALADELGDDYQMTVIGLPPEKIRELPKNVLGIARTDSPLQLAGFYVLAHAYVNASFEENYPTTNLEAVSCGTPVITYDCGGSGESAVLHGKVVRKGDIAALADAVRSADSFVPADPESYDLSRRAMTEKYIDIYMTKGADA